jgi:DNA-binding FrmR family transcriptional regulator
MSECCERRKKERDDEERRALINRLLRIEGQVRGVRGMVENDAYCIDIITQVAAISAALGAFNKELLSSHIRTCVSDDIKAGNDDAVDELLATLTKLIK